MMCCYRRRVLMMCVAEVAGVTVSILESGSESWSEKFSKLRIRTLLKLRLPSMQPRFSNAFTEDMCIRTMQTPAANENDK